MSPNPPYSTYIGRVTRSQTGSLPLNVTNHQSKSVDENSRVRRNKRRRTTSKAEDVKSDLATLTPIPFRLMDLPVEIRVQILKMWLWQAAPLSKTSIRSMENHPDYDDDGVLDIFHYDDEKNFDFYPAILRCSKQLNDEGQDILYNNTLQVSISGSPNFDAHVLALGRDVKEACWLVKPWCNFTKVHIDYYLWHFERKKCTHDITGYESSRHQQAILELSVQLEDMPKLKEVVIQVRKGCRKYAADNPVAERALEPLSVLRNLETVEIEGVSESYAEELKILMKGSTDTGNMLRMMRRLEDAVETMLSDEDVVRESLDDAWSAVWSYSWEDFKDARMQVFQELLFEVCASVWVPGEPVDDLTTMGIALFKARLRGA